MKTLKNILLASCFVLLVVGCDSGSSDSGGGEDSEFNFAGQWRGTFGYGFTPQDISLNINPDGVTSVRNLRFGCVGSYNTVQLSGNTLILSPVYNTSGSGLCTRGRGNVVIEGVDGDSIYVKFYDLGVDYTNGSPSTSGGMERQ